MSASWLIVIASLLFAVMGVCVKLASSTYGSGEIVMYRGLVGALMIGAMSLWRGDTLRTTVPGKHALRSLTGVTALCLWFYAIGKLPLATAMTLNYTSSLWIALFLIGGASVLRTKQADGRLVFAALLGGAALSTLTGWHAHSGADRQTHATPHDRWRQVELPGSDRERTVRRNHVNLIGFNEYALACHLHRHERDALEQLRQQRRLGRVHVLNHDIGQPALPRHVTEEALQRLEPAG